MDLVHPLDVDDDAAAQRDGAVGEPGTAVARDDGDPVRVRDPDHLGNLLGGLRQHDQVGDCSAQRCTGNGAGTRARL